MKWLFMSLVLVNLALYLWARGHPDNAPAVASVFENEVNSRAMLLLSEVQQNNAALQQACLRIGPFQTQSTFANASRILEEMGLVYNKTAVSARKLKTWRVSMIAPEAAGELDEIRERLRALNIEHYKFEENESARLSLGLFSQATDARRFVATLKEDSIEAAYRPELRTLGPLRWIELSQAPDKFAIEKLNETQWGDALASISEVPCEV